MVVSCFQRVRQQCILESFYTTGTQKQNCAYIVDAFCGLCNSVFAAMGCHYHFSLRQGFCPSLAEKGVQRGNKKRELDEERKQNIEEKGFFTVEMYECDWR